jgi:hypothetical protein
MASAAAYDEWEDPGKAFSDQEVEGYSVLKEAEARMQYLHRQLLLVEKARTFKDHAKPAWMTKQSKRLLQVMGWLCKAVELEGFNDEEMKELPLATSAAGKALAKEAQQIDWEGWINHAIQSTEAALIYHVSLSRRCAGRWAKRERSLSNKYANALNGQRRSFQQALVEFQSSKKAND